MSSSSNNPDTKGFSEEDSTHSTSKEPLALPDSSTSVGGGVVNDDVRSLKVGGSLSLDDLGPIIVNKDGTTSRVTNWLEMGKEEQERTQRMIKKRNEKRLKELKEKMDKGEL
eukprot:CAMPEP_0118654480 /NCGR_PEP_ID=MMETSP0785-20121206/12418_1 /TAXON_ID=91992 /ORGANISM="Bolidomonas pacifica, Strain CCMP 1866" /LENGTH=111 /DNA_ID=CAMNT_0006547155 /DNA_START=209 /DNA_END=544 /DNA_ORIENTATION=-